MAPPNAIGPPPACEFWTDRKKVKVTGEKNIHLHPPPARELCTDWKNSEMAPPMIKAGSAPV